MIENKKKYHHGDLREALIEAIRALIERDGPDSFSIAEACRMAGVSTAAPYKHFDGRDDMIRAVALAGMARLHTRMVAAADAHPAGDPRRLVGLGHAYIDFAKTEPGVFRLTFSMAADQEEDGDLKASGDAANGLVARIVAEHLHIDPNSPEAQMRAYALWCFVHGHSFLSLDGKVDPHLTPDEETAFLSLVGDAMLPPRG